MTLVALTCGRLARKEASERLGTRFLHPSRVPNSRF